MRDSAILATAWLGFAAHVVVGVIAWRDRSYVTLIALLNLVTAGCVLVYWAYRWYGYLFRGITWYAADQVFPIYAAVVTAIAILSLSGRYHAIAPNWLALALDGLVLLAAALFFSFFRLNRLF